MKTKNKIGLIASILLLALALPFWVGALSNQPPAITEFLLGEESTLEPGEKVKFKFNTYDKEDDRLSGTLYYGDGERDSFRFSDDRTITKTHEYENDGDYTVRLKVEDDDGAKSESSFTITIGEGGASIDQFRLQDQSTLQVNKKVYFQYRVCGPNEDDLEAWLHFGDGEKVEIGNFCTKGLKNHEYDNPGEYEVKLVAETGDDQKVEKKINLSIWLEGNEMPKADFTYSPEQIEVGDRVEFQNKSVDPDDVTEIESYRWEFSDADSSEEKNTAHFFNEAGTYKVTLTVTDSSGLKDKKWLYFYVYPKFQSGTLASVPIRQKIWRLRNGRKHWIPSPDAFYSYGYSPDNIEKITIPKINSYPRVKLIRKVGDSGRIYYITEAGLIRRHPNMESFRSYDGNKLEDVVEVSETELNSYERVKAVKLPYSHKVYKLEKRGDQIVKRWVKTMDAFHKLDLTWREVAPVNHVEFEAYPTVEPVE